MRGTERSSGRLFALKVVEREELDKMAKRNPYVQWEILQEKRIVSRLDHPHVVKLHNTFQDPDALYFQYEFVTGGELWSHIMRPLVVGVPQPLVPAPLPYEQVQEVIRQCTVALAYLHSQGVVMRDLKPENIMLCPTDGAHATTAVGGTIPFPFIVKLIDFGTAKDLLYPRYNHRAEFVGTAEYMAPEVIDNGGLGRGRPVDTTADLWALGCLTYQLLAGITPFRDASDFLTMQRVTQYAALHGETEAPIQLQLRFPPGTPEDARDFIQRLLHPVSSMRLGAGMGSLPGSAVTVDQQALDEDSRNEADDIARRTKALKSAPQRAARVDAPLCKPSSTTVPRDPVPVDHNVLLRHPFLGRPAAAAETPAAEEAHRKILELVDSMSLTASSTSTTGPLLTVASDSVGLQHAIMYHLALRRRAGVPRVLSAFTAVPGLARCAAVRLTDSADGALTLGTVSPRERLGWNAAPQSYAHASELNDLVRACCHLPSGSGSDASSDAREVIGEAVNALDWRLYRAADWNGAHSMVVLSNLRLRASDAASLHALDRAIAAINRFSPPPRAIVVLGQLAHVDKDSTDDYRAAATSLFLSCMAKLSHQCISVIMACTDVDLVLPAPDGRYVQPPPTYHWGASMSGVRLVGVTDAEKPSSGQAWLEQELTAACSTCQHTVMLATHRPSADELHLLPLQNSNVRYILTPADGRDPALGGSEPWVPLQADGAAQLPAPEGARHWPVHSLVSSPSDEVVVLPVVLCKQFAVEAGYVRVARGSEPVSLPLDDAR